MESAIDHAIEDIKAKAEDKQKHMDNKGKPIEPKSYCKELDLQLEEGRKSPLLLSPGTNRKEVRREAVSEKNETERCLVTESLKNLIQES